MHHHELRLRMDAAIGRTPPLVDGELQVPFTCQPCKCHPCTIWSVQPAPPAVQTMDRNGVALLITPSCQHSCSAPPCTRAALIPACSSLHAHELSSACSAPAAVAG